MNEFEEQRIEALLRAEFDPSIPPADFCDRVLAELPERRSPRHWPVPVGAAIGVAACGFKLSSASLLGAGWQDWLSGQWSGSLAATLFALALAGVLAMAWALAEADDWSGIAPKLLQR